MNLFEELRCDAVDDSVSLSRAMRRAKVLASILDNPSFSDWVNSELSGYPSNDVVPGYRKINAQSLGHFQGPYNSRVENQPLPTANLPDDAREYASEVTFTEGIRELEGLLQSEGSKLRRVWPAELVILTRDSFKMTGGYTLVYAYQPVPKAKVEGVLDSVRNRLLDFVLELSDINPRVRESEHAFKDIPENRVEKIFNVTIYGDHNVLAGGENVSQVVHQEIVPNDLDSLLEYFNSLGISESDLGNLEKAIKTDGSRSNQKLGTKVREWIGKMTAKAGEGTWEVAVDTASKLLIQGILAYYGWN